jgi:urea transport system ATP-binding protein
MLTVNELSVAYGMSPVLYGIDLNVDAGECVALLGRNGAGKSTLLRTIMGLHPECGGKVVFEGDDITMMPPFQRARRGIGYVPQGRGIFPHLTVQENLCMGLSALSGRGINSAVPDYVYELFPVLKKLQQRKGGVLSGGEQQQLAIGRALVMQPKLLILDEPTEGIQPSIIQQIDDAIQTICKHLRISILLVEQFLDFVWSIADRFYVLRRGAIADQGNPCDRAPDSIVHLLNV